MSRSSMRRLRCHAADNDHAAPEAAALCGPGDEARYRGHEAFFKVFKERVGAAWNPVAAWLTVPRSVKDRYQGRANTIVSTVRVELARDGSVHQLTTTVSGVLELDEEARRAILAAAPFANPPMELTHGDVLRLIFRCAARSDTTATSAMARHARETHCAGTSATSTISGASIVRAISSFASMPSRSHRADRL
jgi:hypothetical protein